MALWCLALTSISVSWTSTQVSESLDQRDSFEASGYALMEYLTGFEMDLGATNAGLHLEIDPRGGEMSIYEKEGG